MVLKKVRDKDLKICITVLSIRTRNIFRSFFDNGTAKCPSFKLILHIQSSSSGIFFNRNGLSILMCAQRIPLFNSFRLITGQFPTCFFSTKNYEVRNWPSRFFATEVELLLNISLISWSIKSVSCCNIIATLGPFNSSGCTAK